MATRVAAAKEVESSILVCDLGFSSLKWYCNGNKGRIVSAIQRQGAVTHIGEDALITTGSSYLKTMEELVNAYPLFCERAAQEAGITGPATLAVGLPYGFWAAEREAPGNGAIGMLERALKGAMFDAVYVLPQGLGGVRAHIEELEQAGQVSGNILGIDIGFNTVIFTLYDPSRNRIIYGDTFNKRGVHQLAMKHLLPRIKALAPSRTYTPVEISYLMERGFVQYGFEQHDIRPQIYESADEYLTIVLQDISGELQAHVGDRAVFNQVVIFGGGARLLDGRISSQTIQIKVLDEPEYANAQGFHAIASQLLDGGA